MRRPIPLFIVLLLASVCIASVHHHHQQFVFDNITGVHRDVRAHDVEQQCPLALEIDREFESKKGHLIILIMIRRFVWLAKRGHRKENGALQHIHIRFDNRAQQIGRRQADEESWPWGRPQQSKEAPGNRSRYGWMRQL